MKNRIPWDQRLEVGKTYIYCETHGYAHGTAKDGDELIYLRPATEALVFRHTSNHLMQHTKSGREVEIFPHFLCKDSNGRQFRCSGLKESS